MYYYLRDFCALIITGAILHDGVTSNIGTIAVYGDGSSAKSLYKYGATESMEALESSFHTEFDFQPRTNIFLKGPIHVSVCVSKSDGIEGLEKLLKLKGFIKTLYENEKKVAKEYMKTAKIYGTRPAGSELDINVIGYISDLGREVASTITMKSVCVFGKYACGASHSNQAVRDIYMDSPLEMGELQIIGQLESQSEKRGLVYINGQLRIITTTLSSEDPSKELIWDIFPKFDATENEGFTDRNMLEDFISESYYPRELKYKENFKENILLGCRKRRKTSLSAQTHLIR